MREREFEMNYLIRWSEIKIKNVSFESKELQEEIQEVFSRNPPSSSRSSDDNLIEWKRHLEKKLKDKLVDKLGVWVLPVRFDWLFSKGYSKNIFFQEGERVISTLGEYKAYLTRITQIFELFEESDLKTNSKNVFASLNMLLKELVDHSQMEPGWRQEFELAFAWLFQFMKLDEGRVLHLVSLVMAHVDKLSDYRLPSVDQIESLSKEMCESIKSA
jgi:hypothetical protein